jgi:hypothetical protein
MIADVITIIVAVIAVVCAAGFYLSWRATRLDRLHARVETASAALDAALLRRCAAVTGLVTACVLDPATALLLSDAEQAARLAEADDQQNRELAESRLSIALRAVYSGPDPEAMSLDNGAGKLDAWDVIRRELEDATRRVSIARHFYNDTVSATLSARRKPLARAFRLAGTAQEPVPFEMDEFLVSGS